MNVLVHVSGYACVSAYTHACTCVCVCTCLQVCLRVCMHVHVYVYVRIWACVGVHARMCVYGSAHVRDLFVSFWKANRIQSLQIFF